jgi:hypothetical protein
MENFEGDTEYMKNRPDCLDLYPNHLHCLSVMAFLLHNEDGCILFGKGSLCYCTAHTSNYPLASLVLSLRLNVKLDATNGKYIY